MSPVFILIITRGISSLGSTLTMFGLNVFVYQKSHSYNIFAYLTILEILPGLLFSPFAGVIADRVSRRLILLICEATSMLLVMSALVLDAVGRLDTIAIATIAFLLAIASELRWSAMAATISRIAPVNNLGRLNALQQSFRGISMMLGPALGAVGIGYLGLHSLLLADTISYLVAIGGLASIPKEPAKKESLAGYKFSLFKELTFGMRWIIRHPELLNLLLFFMSVNIGLSIFNSTLSPYLLSTGSNKLLGLGLAAQGAGAFSAGMLFTYWRKPARPEKSIVSGSFGLGCTMVIWGVTKDPLLLCLVIFLLGALTTQVSASSQTLWQIKVPNEIQGKVFSVRTMVSSALAPLSVLVSVPLASYIFEPFATRLEFTRVFWGPDLKGALGLMNSTFGILVILCSLIFKARGGVGMTNKDSTSQQLARQGPPVK